MSQQKIILVGGPTASGKSALALELARAQSGTIINADAMQVYSGLPILSAQPSPEDQQDIPHKLYGIMNPAEASSAGKWRDLAVAAIQETLRQGRTPILVGGTGLYFRALLGGLADIPPIPEEVRAETQKLYDKLGEETFRKSLAKLDNESASRIARNDRQRLIRAYEVVTHTGKTLGAWHHLSDRTMAFPSRLRATANAVARVDLEDGLRHLGLGAGGELASPRAFDPSDISPPSHPASGRGAPEVIFEPHPLLPDREQLYAACDRRFLLMIKRGAIEEVQTFLKLALDPTLPAMKTIGVREIGAYLKGEWTLEEAITKAQQATRNYAKRQLTWFRNQGMGAS